MSLSILAVIFIAYFNTDPVRCDCLVPIFGMSTNTTPLYLDEQLNIPRPSPFSPNSFTLRSSKHLQLFCPNGHAELGTTMIHLDYDLASVLRCDGNRLTSTMHGVGVDLQNFKCSRSLTPHAWSANKNCYNGLGEVYYLGYVVGQGLERPIVEVCFSASAGTTYWASSKISQAILIPHTTSLTPSFAKAGLFRNINVALCYTNTRQKETLPISLLDYFSKYPKETTYFQKGHLIANADMFYAAEKTATYIYANALPMWSRINNGNWKNMEAEARWLLKAHGDLSVVAGGLGVLQLGGRNVYLCPGDKVPVPKILYKIVYSPHTKRGVVYLAINNPFVKNNELPGYMVCNQHRYQSCGWRDPEKYRDLKKGYMWCCTIRNFLQSPMVQALGADLGSLIPGLTVDVSTFF